MKDQDNVNQIVWIVAAAAAIFRGATAQDAANVADETARRFDAFENMKESR